MGKSSKSALLSIKLSVSLGQRLQDPQYKVTRAYLQGYSHTALAKELKKRPEFSEYGMNELAHGVRCALVGNSDDKFGSTYEGTIPQEVYLEHARRHRVTSGKSNGLQRLKERRGIHGLDTDKLKENALKAAQARGETPWAREELSKVLSLSLLEIFKLNGQVSYGPIADNLNRTFYGGKEVRTNVSVREALRRLQRSFNKK